MASKLIGRTDCPECGFKSAHVKQSDKCTYRYCPECGAQHHAKTERQKADLLGKTRLIEPVPSATPTPTGEAAPGPALEVAPTPSPTPPTPTPTPKPAQVKRSALFGF